MSGAVSMATKLLHMAAASTATEPTLTLELSLGGTFSSNLQSSSQAQRALVSEQGPSPSSPEPSPVNPAQSMSNPSLTPFTSFPDPSANSSDAEVSCDFLKRQIQAKRRQEARKRRKFLIEEKQQKRARRDELMQSSSHALSSFVPAPQLGLNRPPLIPSILHFPGAAATATPEFNNAATGENLPDSVVAAAGSQTLVKQPSDTKRTPPRKPVNASTGASTMAESNMHGCPASFQSLITPAQTCTSCSSPVSASCASSYIASDDKSCHSSSSELENEDAWTDEQSSTVIQQNKVDASDPVNGGMYSHHHHNQHSSMMIPNHVAMPFSHMPMAPYPYPMPLPWGFSLPCYMQYPAPVSVSSPFSVHAGAGTIPANAATSAFAPYQLLMPENRSFPPWFPVVPMATAPSQLTEGPVIHSADQESGPADEDMEAEAGSMSVKEVLPLPVEEDGSVTSLAANVNVPPIHPAIHYMESKLHQLMEETSRIPEKMEPRQWRCTEQKMHQVMGQTSQIPEKMDPKMHQVMGQTSQIPEKMDPKMCQVMGQTSEIPEKMDPRHQHTELEVGHWQVSDAVSTPSFRSLECSDQEENEDDARACHLINTSSQEEPRKKNRYSSISRKPNNAALSNMVPKKAKVVRFNGIKEVRDERLPRLVSDDKARHAEKLHDDEEDESLGNKSLYNVKDIEEHDEDGEMASSGIAKDISSVRAKSIVGPKTLANLPRVSTTGTGPNGKTINGIMYISEDKQPRLICICHGKDMSALGFVQHSGSSDLTTPERRIKINYMSTNNV